MLHSSHSSQLPRDGSCTPQGPPGCPGPEDPVPQPRWLLQAGLSISPLQGRGMGPNSGSHWGVRNGTFDLCGQPLQKPLGEGPSQASTVSPGTIPLNPSTLPRVPLSHCTLWPHAGACFEQHMLGPSKHPSTAGGMCPPLDTAPCPLCNPKAQRRTWCCCAPSCAPQLPPGTGARAPCQQLMGKFRVGASHGRGT